MCSKCDEIDSNIARYRRLRENIADQQMGDAADRMLAGLEAEKRARHPEE